AITLVSVDPLDHLEEQTSVQQWCVQVEEFTALGDVVVQDPQPAHTFLLCRGQIRAGREVVVVVVGYAQRRYPRIDHVLGDGEDVVTGQSDVLGTTVGIGLRPTPQKGHVQHDAQR